MPAIAVADESSDSGEFRQVVSVDEEAVAGYSGTVGNCTWELDGEGVLTIAPIAGTDGLLPSFSSSKKAPWLEGDLTASITSVVFEPGMSTQDTAYMFYGCSNLASVEGLDALDTSRAKSMDSMFYACSSLTSLDVSSFDTSSVTDMAGMFYRCTSLPCLDVSSFDTSKVTSMNSMFMICKSLQSLDVSGFDTSNVTDMMCMFDTCSSLTSLNLSSFDTSSVTDMMYMFYSCSSLTSLDLSGWDTSNVTNMGYMFSDCSSLESLDVSGFDTSNVTDMICMFRNCSSLTSLDVSGFDTSAVTGMDSMFNGCSSLVSIDVSSFVFPSNASNIFSGLADSSTIYVATHENYDYLTRNSWLYYSIDKTTVKLKGQDSQLTEGWNQFGTCEWLIDSAGRLTIRPLGNGDVGVLGKYSNNGSVPWWSSSDSIKSVVVEDGVIAGSGSLNGFFHVYESLESLDLAGLETSSVTDMGSMFYGCSSLTSLDLSGWDTSNVTNMRGMFSACSSLTSLDLSGWDTSNVTNMGYMFSACSSLTSLDLSGWDTSNASNMAGMFDNCYDLVALDVSSFDTSRVTDMTYMFSHCKSMGGIDVSNFSFASCSKNMYSMFDDLANPSTVYVATQQQYSLIKDNLSGNKTSVVVKGTGPALTQGWSQYGTCEWFIDSKGCLVIRPLGDGDSGVLNSNSIILVDAPWADRASEVTSAVVEAGVRVGDRLGGMFEGCSNMLSVDLSGLDTSSMTYMSSMFYGCSSLEALDLSGFDTSNVTSMSFMFSGCSSLEALDLSGFDTSAVTGMDYMFYKCSSLEALDLSGFDTSAVTRMGSMFNGCSSLVAIKLGDDFSFNGAGEERLCSLPTPSGEGFTGKWENQVTRETYASDQIPNNLAAIYVAQGEADLVPVDKPAAAPGLAYTGREQVGVPAGEGYGLSGTAKATDAGSYSATATLLDGYVWSDGTSGPKPISWSIAPAAISQASVEAIPAQAWTGSAVEPEIELTFNGMRLSEGVDYEASYKNNTSVGIASAIAVGKGNFDGEMVVDFSIESLIAATPEPVLNLVYTGSEQVGVLAGEGYSLSGDFSAVRAGSHTAVATLADGYAWSDGTTGEKAVSWSIAKAEYDMSGVSFGGAVATYDGSPHSIAVSGGLPDGVSVSYSGNGAVNAGSHAVTASFEGDAANFEPIPSMSATLTIEPAGISAASGLSIGDQPWTGSAVEPKLSLTFNGAALVEGADYSISYRGNVAAGTATATVSGKGNFQGEAEVPFEIVKEAVAIERPVAATGLAYTGREQVGVPAGEGYGLSGTAKATDAGTYSATATLLEGYEWSDGSAGPVTLAWSIEPASISQASVESVPAQSWTGSAIEPELLISFNGARLVEGVDYEVSYESNVGVGAANAIVSGMGNFQGYVEVSFEIERASFDMSGVSFKDATVTYDGKAHSVYISGELPEGLSVSYAGNGRADAGIYEVVATFSADADHVAPAPMTARLTIEPAAISEASVVAIGDQPWTGSAVEPKLSLSFEGRALYEGSDYEVSYEGNVEVGTAKAIAVGIGNFQGSVEVEFEIVKEVVLIAKPVAASGLVYTGSEQEGVPAGEGYGLSGTAKATDAGTYSATATLLEGYEWSDGSVGPVTLAWSIAKAGISAASGLSIGAQPWTGSAVEPGLSLSFNGRTLVEGADYSISYRGNVAAGTATATVSGKGNFQGSVEIGFEIVREPVPVAAPAAVKGLAYTGREQVGVPAGEGYVLSGTAKATDAGSYSATATLLEGYEWSDGTSGPKSISWSIAPAAISRASVEAIPAQVWTGSAVEPKPSLSFNGAALVEGTDYTVSYTNNVAAGTATATVSGKGNFQGEAEVAFEIVREAVAIERPVAATSLAYTGREQVGVSVGEGYELSGTAKATDAGSYSATATLLDGYVWSDGSTDAVSLSWSIAKAEYDMSGVSFEGVSATYDGEPHSLCVSGELPEGLSVTYAGNGRVDAGTYEVVATFSADSNHVAPAPMRAELTIEAANISEAFIAAVGDQPWTGSAVEPKPSLSFNGAALVEGTDYTVSYTNNVAAGTATATVSGKGNFQGEAEVPFEIVEASGTWRKDAAGWWYERADGTWPFSCWEDVDGERYRFDARGYMMTGWVLVDGFWYFMGSDGALRTGWLWDGAWYYLDPESDGAMATGWLDLGDGWRYLAPSGALQFGWLRFGGSWYYLDPADDGVMRTGWLWDGAWYYLDPENDGRMATGLVSDGSGTYFMSESGAMQTGWVGMADGWRYFASSGALRTGWLWDGAWYYLDPEFGGRMATGWVEVEGEWYYLYGSGKMASSCWVGDYYLTSSGAMATNQWVGQWYVGADGKWIPGYKEN